MTQALRFGLVGTGHWARITHAPALASTDGIDFAAVWGRNTEAAAGLAASVANGRQSDQVARAPRSALDFLASRQLLAIFKIEPTMPLGIKVMQAIRMPP